MLSVAHGQARESDALAAATETSDEGRTEAVSERVTAKADRYEGLADRLGLACCGHPH